MLDKFKNFLVNKKIAISAGVILLVLVFVFAGSKEEKFATISPAYGDLARTVQATGQVVSDTDLELSFGKSGTVTSVRVKVGDKVKSGMVLASLDTSNDQANLTKARASLLAAEAKLRKVIEGASNEEIALARVNLENAKQDLINTENTQNTSVKNAYVKMLNSTLEASPKDGSSFSQTVPLISGTYNSSLEGRININVYSSGSGLLFSTDGLVNAFGQFSTTTPQMIGDSGLYILFPSNVNMSGTNWVIQIPNQKASDYLTNYNAYQSALKTRESTVAQARALVSQRQAEFDLKLASARGADVDLAKAEVLLAKGEVERARALYEDNLIKSRQNATVTKVNIKYGEFANMNNPVISLQDVDNLYVESLINESNIARIKVGQPVSIALDALPGKEFEGEVFHIDPSAITTDGVVNYKIKVLLKEKTPEVRPGMNAEISITIFKKENIVSVPQATIYERQGEFYLKLVSNNKSKKLKEIKIQKGDLGDGNLVEIVAGVSKDDLVAISDKK